MACELPTATASASTPVASANMAASAGSASGQTRAKARPLTLLLSAAMMTVRALGHQAVDVRLVVGDLRAPVRTERTGQLEGVEPGDAARDDQLDAAAHGQLAGDVDRVRHDRDLLGLAGSVRVVARERPGHLGRRRAAGQPTTAPSGISLAAARPMRTFSVDVVLLRYLTGRMVVGNTSSFLARASTSTCPLSVIASRTALSLLCLCFDGQPARGRQRWQSSQNGSDAVPLAGEGTRRGGSESTGKSQRRPLTVTAGWLRAALQATAPRSQKR
jgi:hypothetical protein